VIAIAVVPIFRSVTQLHAQIRLASTTALTNIPIGPRHFRSVIPPPYSIYQVCTKPGQFVGITAFCSKIIVQRILLCLSFGHCEFATRML
jgi:hypothetical protein